MQVIKYRQTVDSALGNGVILCKGCNPIILQVFYSDFEDERLMDGHDYEPGYWAFDFLDNEYGKFIADLKEEVENEKKYKDLMYDIYTATPIFTHDIRRVEKELASLIPLQPERTFQTSYIYDSWAKGNELFHLGEYDKAVEQYKTVLNLSCQANDVRLSLAIAYYFIGDYANARRVMDIYNPYYYDTYPTSRVGQFYELLQLKMAS